jgi:replicative DNA helicase
LTSHSNFIDNSDYDIKRIPYSLDAEMSVLGAILISPGIYDEIVETLSVDDFYLPNHKDIYESITHLYLKNRSIDLVTLLDDIVSKGPRSDDSARNTAKEYLMRLSDNVPVVGNIKEYAGIVKEKSLRRKLISVSGEIIKMAYEDPSGSDIIIDRAEQMIFALMQGTVKQDFVHVKHIMASVFANIHSMETDKEATKGISSGFSGIDNILVGMSSGDLIVIGARPGVGKTAFALNVAMNAAARKKTIAVFELEMSKEQIVARLLTSESFVDNYKLRTGILTEGDWSKITEAGARISECDIYIDDTPSMTVTAMKAKLRRLKKLDLVIIDHLQLMQTDRGNGNRVQEISDISKNLKILAKELDVPVITCAQLSRGPESRDNKRPMLSDLRESGSIEQDADVVMFLYRDDYYKDNVEKHNRAEIIFSKNRHGSLGMVEIGFEKKFGRFYDIDEVHKEP